MKEGGIGGNSTSTGLRFERKTDLSEALAACSGYSILGNIVYYNEKQVAEICKGHSLYKFLEKRGVDWKNIISQRLIPDEAIFINSKNLLIVIEKKYQQSEGSVDEKIQTCDYKKKQYQKLVKPLSLNFKFIYVLNDWYKDKKYIDPLAYIEETGSQYFFDIIPLDELGLP